MLVSKENDKVPIWSDNANLLDNIAYHLYLDEYMYNGTQIFSQKLFMHLYEKQPYSIKYYREAKLLLRKIKLNKIKDKINGEENIYPEYNQEYKGKF